MLEALEHLPEDRKSVQAIWGRALTGEEFTEIAEFGDSNRDRRSYEIKFNTLRNGKGEPIGAYQFVYDVTERLLNQEQLAEAQAKMHEMAKLETLGQLTGGVAHDFNNLLTPIVGALDMLHRKYADDSRSGRLIVGALDAAERAATLVQRLLSFARRQNLEARPIDVGQLVEGILDLIGRSIGSGVPVQLKIEENLPPAKIDPNQLELALLNLAVNASDAMAGVGSLTIDVRGRTLKNAEIAGLKAGDYIRLSVSDTGTGMDEATIKRAIEPFFTTKGAGKGTGLGLSMVHGLAAQSGGALRLRSKAGKGTTAEIWLPVTSDAAHPLTMVEGGLAPQPRNTVILAVDDEDLVRRATAEMIRDLGHEVLEAPSASVALQMLESRPDIEIMVTDYLMPGIRGGELIEKSKAIRPDLRALLITGYARLGIGELAGIARISKPFRASDLAREIGKLLADGQVIDMATHRKGR